MSYRAVILFASLLLAGACLVIALLAGRLEERRLMADLDQQALRLKTAFDVLQIELQHEMVSIADLLASDQDARRLLAEAAAVVRAEGGGRGGERAAQVREALRRRIAPQWETLHQEIGLQQIHVHLAPATTSFLRMRAPEVFGDALWRSRQLIPDVQRDGQRRSGFEIGPSYAGVRGVVPVWAPGSESGVLIGSLEVGVSFAGHVERLSGQTGVGYGVLLNQEAVVETMLETYHPPQVTGGLRGDYLLAASRPELADWLAHSRMPDYADTYRVTRLDWQGQLFQVIRFPLRDYLGQLDAARPPIGSIIIWHNVSEPLQKLKQLRQQINGFSLAGYLVAQSLLLGVLFLLRREWQRQLDAQTADLIQLATTDALTGLFNRRYFLEQLTQQLVRLNRLHEPCALLMVDLDFFKRVNDTYGHATGDRVLQHFTAVARGALRKIDLIGRIGGEEFAVLLPGVNGQGALDAAERLRQAVADTLLRAEEDAIPITVSVGMTLLDGADRGPDAALQRADAALYQAKSAGRNRVGIVLPKQPGRLPGA